MLNKQSEKIFADVDDEVVFIIERIKSSAADRIILIVPGGALIISSLITLKLLSKLVYKLGKAIILVSADTQGLLFASKAGILGVKNTDEITDELWAESESKVKRRGLYPVLGKKKNEPIVEKNEQFIGGKMRNIEPGEETISEEFKDSKVVSLEDFGFVADIDIKTQKLEAGDKKDDQDMDYKIEEEESDSDNVVHNPKSARYDKYRKQKSRSRLFGLMNNINKRKLKKGVLIPLLILIVIAVSFLSVYMYFIAPSAQVAVYIETEPFSFEEEVQSSSDVTDVDIEGLEIPLSKLEVEENGSESAVATGTALIGDKAKGKVTIVNKTEEEISLEKGTSLKGLGFVFVLIKDETIPAADIFAGTLGRGEVDVEAYDIGENYNLQSSTEFSIEGYTTSALVGKSFEAFSGGSKREVTVVTDEDQRKLREMLESRLKDVAKTKVKEQSGSTFSEDQIDLEIKDERFDAQVGQEKQNLNIDMTVKATAYVYSQKDVQTLAVQLSKSRIESGHKLLEEDLKPESAFIRREGAVVVLLLKVDGLMSKDISKDYLSDIILSKSIDKARQELLLVDGVESCEISTGPSWLPKVFQHIPRLKSKLQIDIKSYGSLE